MGCKQGWLFAMAKSIFAGTVEKTGKNRQKLENAVYVTGIRSSTLPGTSKRLNLLNLNLQLKNDSVYTIKTCFCFEFIR
jgi:hypothetical protein